MKQNRHFVRTMGFFASPNSRWLLVQYNCEAGFVARLLNLANQQLFLLLTAILVACTAEVSQETPSPVAIIIEIRPPAGDSPTETATPLPTLSPTPPPAPAGRILFFWTLNHMSVMPTIQGFLNQGETSNQICI